MLMYNRQRLENALDILPKGELAEGVSERTGHDWMNAHAEFEEQIMRARADCISVMVGHIRKAGKDTKNWPSLFRFLESIAPEECAGPETKFQFAQQINGISRNHLLQPR
jgi:hypothetical protein